VAARANILVAASASGAAALIGALAGAGGADDGLVLLQEGDELLLGQPHATSIVLGETDAERGHAAHVAARLRPDRLVAPSFTGEVAAELVDAMSEGLDGVIASSRSPSLRQGVARLSADLASRRAGVSPEVARQWLASVFDLAIEVARLRDGRLRVLRVAELAAEPDRTAPRDIFTFTIERTAAGGAIEGSFVATGQVPRILEDLAARGIAVDTSVFRRHTRAEHGPEADAGPQPSPRAAHGEPPKSPARP
jgi:pilus assembly protein CpaF